jgi:hypothetical protein
MEKYPASKALGSYDLCYNHIRGKKDKITLSKQEQGVIAQKRTEPVSVDYVELSRRVENEFGLLETKKAGLLLVQIIL